MATPNKKKKAVKQLSVRLVAKKKAVKSTSNLKPVPEGSSVVADSIVTELTIQRDSYRETLSEVSSEFHKFKQSKDFTDRPQDAQNEIVAILMKFPMNLQNVILSCSLTILKGQRTAAIDDAIELVLSKNKEIAEAELVLELAKSCETGFNETVIAAASKLH